MEPNDRERRREHIRELLDRKPIQDQYEIVQALSKKGFKVTQSSVSRDLREMRIAKVEGAYRMPRPLQFQGDQGLSHAVAESLRGTARAGANLLVLKTTVGSAARLGVLIDAQGWSEMIGSIAGDDTLFLATPGAREQKRLESRLRNLADLHPIPASTVQSKKA